MAPISLGIWDGEKKVLQQITPHLGDFVLFSNKSLITVKVSLLSKFVVLPALPGCMSCQPAEGVIENT